MDEDWIRLRGPAGHPFCDVAVMFRPDGTLKIKLDKDEPVQITQAHLRHKPALVLRKEPIG